MPSDDLLRRLINDGFLKEHPNDPGQVNRLLARALRDLKTAEANLAIDAEAAYTFSYLAMLRSGRGLMLAKGLRPADGRQHRTVVEVSSHFLGKDGEDLAYGFERMRRKRNQFTYDPDIPLGLQEARDALKTAQDFVNRMMGIVRNESPGLDAADGG